MDWNKERYVTGHQWVQMRPDERWWFEQQPNIWRNDPCRDVLVNCAHPKNADWALNDLINEVKRNG